VTDDANAKVGVRVWHVMVSFCSRPGQNNSLTGSFILQVVLVISLRYRYLARFESDQ
jgi:hypothetical protein